MAENPSKKIYLTVMVAALGYFVDIYDLLLFLVIGKQSLLDLGVPEANLNNTKIDILNIQMIGLLIGGLFWGILADKKGRLSVLFGSIIMYSLANLANGFINTVEQYMLLRFIAGVGLAGELGAGITLVNEVMTKEQRGYGVTIVASVGLLGAVVASLVGEQLGWRTAFWVGGGMGLALLFLRVGVAESGLFDKAKQKSQIGFIERDKMLKTVVIAPKVQMGNFFMLFSNLQRFKTYFFCILGTIPVWFVIGLLIHLCESFGKTLNMKELPTSGRAIMFCYLGLSIGDMISGILSQQMKSRKAVQYIFIIISAALSGVYLFADGISLTNFYTLCFFLGLFSGYWVISVTSASEQFGTNLRATVTTSVPNFVRGSLFFMTMFYKSLLESQGQINSALIVGGVVFVVALLSVSQLKETYGKDLNFNEE